MPSSCPNGNCSLERNGSVEKRANKSANRSKKSPDSLQQHGPKGSRVTKTSNPQVPGGPRPTSLRHTASSITNNNVSVSQQADSEGVKRPDAVSSDGHVPAISHLMNSSPKPTTLKSSDIFTTSSSSSPDLNVAVNPTVISGTVTSNVPDSTAVQLLPAASIYGYDYIACQARCKVPNCSICYPQQVNPVGSQFIQRPIGYQGPTPVAAAASGVTYCPDSTAPAYYIWFGSEAQKRMYQTQLALSQLNVNTPQSVSLPAKYSAPGIPITQQPINAVDGAVMQLPGGMVQDSVLTVGPQSVSSQSLMAVSSTQEGSTQISVNNNIVNHGVQLTTQPLTINPNDSSVFCGNQCTVGFGPTGLARFPQTIYSSNPTSSTSSVDGLTPTSQDHQQVIVDGTTSNNSFGTSNPNAAWTTYMGQNGLWFPPTYPNYGPAYYSPLTVPVCHISPAAPSLVGIADPTLVSGRSSYPNSTLTPRIPDKMNTPNYYTSSASSMLANAMKYNLSKAYAPIHGLTPNSAVLCAGSPVAGTTVPSSAQVNCLNVSPHWSSLLNALRPPVCSLLPYHPSVAYDPGFNRSVAMNMCRRRACINNHLPRAVPTKSFDAAELAALNLAVNPVELDESLLYRARFFMIKSDCEYNVQQAIRHSVWCSTRVGNQCLEEAFQSVQPTFANPEGTHEVADNAHMYDTTSKNFTTLVQSDSVEPERDAPSPAGHILLFFSVRSSGYLSGVAEMIGPVNPQKRRSIWNDTRFRGEIPVRWLYVKNVPNNLLKHILIESHDNRPVTGLRDASEILPAAKGEEVLRIVHNYDPHRATSLPPPYCD
ncbi:hypothetical protein P879_04625 [Paragonimus westermani]|uniref:YTH domain-containing protein n=1 Tax=Paragonimus westermani TaxID=34504 RepID=A0A8T0D2C7_9TREM|nr:hypothetical protein P879_04625 [Paragonimus westermani]